jgi:hypothetical protein
VEIADHDRSASQLEIEHAIGSSVEERGQETRMYLQARYMHTPGGPPLHVPLTQSVPARHVLVLAPFGQLEPPQSMSVSSPSRIRSVQ